jgi:hypothetical protein
MAQVRYTNTSSVPLSLAVFLATDNYDHNDDPHTISATALIKPLRQLILSARVPQELAMPDLAQMLASRYGSALHDAIERSWTHNYATALSSIGIPDKVIGKVLINPTEDQLYDGCIPIYLEQRVSKKVGKYTVSGKFDFVGDGRVEDFKSTGVYTYIKGGNEEKYILQGSIYRWLNPKIITKDTMAIQFLFTDWSSMAARQSPDYPQRRFQEMILNLRSVLETEVYIKRRLSDIDDLWDAPEDTLPQCTDAELWRTEPVYKYYKGDPATAKRSTKNFDSKQEAMIFMATVNGVGSLVEKPGNVSACKYCAGFPVCTQKDALIAAGDLVL